MGRSVSTPSGAAVIVYADVGSFEEDFEWDDLIENISAELRAKYPTLDEADEWLGREVKAFLENKLAYVTVSEYCGLAAFCLVPKEVNRYDEVIEALSNNWVNKIAKGFEKIVGNYADTYNKVATFSNGEGVYEKRTVKNNLQKDLTGTEATATL